MPWESHRLFQRASVLLPKGQEACWKMEHRDLPFHRLQTLGSAMNRATSFTACCTSTQLARIVALLNVDALSPSSFVSICGVHSCTFPAEVPTGFSLAPSGVVYASKISRWRGSASIFVWLRDPKRHTQVTSRIRIMTVLSSPSSGPRIAHLLRVKFSLSLEFGPRQLH